MDLEGPHIQNSNLAGGLLYNPLLLCCMPFCCKIPSVFRALGYRSKNPERLNHLQALGSKDSKALTPTWQSFQNIWAKKLLESLFIAHQLCQADVIPYLVKGVGFRVRHFGSFFVVGSGNLCIWD